MDGTAGAVSGGQIMRVLVLMATDIVAQNPAPFPSMIVVFNEELEVEECES